MSTSSSQPGPTVPQPPAAPLDPAITQSLAKADSADIKLQGLTTPLINPATAKIDEGLLTTVLFPGFEQQFDAATGLVSYVLNLAGFPAFQQILARLTALEGTTAPPPDNSPQVLALAPFTEGQTISNYRGLPTDAENFAITTNFIAAPGPGTYTVSGSGVTYASGGWYSENQQQQDVVAYWAANNGSSLTSQRPAGALYLRLAFVKAQYPNAVLTYTPTPS